MKFKKIGKMFFGILYYEIGISKFIVFMIVNINRLCYLNKNN